MAAFAIRAMFLSLLIFLPQQIFSCRSKAAFRNILQIITNIVISTFTTKEIRTTTCSRDPPSPPYLRRLPLEMCSGPTQTPWQIETINPPIPLNKSTALPPRPSKDIRLRTSWNALQVSSPPRGFLSERRTRPPPERQCFRERCHVSSKTVFNHCLSCLVSPYMYVCDIIEN